jgi:hypothetical protein
MQDKVRFLGLRMQLDERVCIACLKLKIRYYTPFTSPNSLIVRATLWVDLFPGFHDVSSCG